MKFILFTFIWSLHVFPGFQGMSIKNGGERKPGRQDYDAHHFNVCVETLHTLPEEINAKHEEFH